jgi:uncharacterized protein YjbJ (UPF0337 family)
MTKDNTMVINSDVLMGKWKQLKGKVRQQWGDLTNDDVDRIQGNYEEFAGILQERYGYSREEADRQIDDFVAKW